MRGGGCECVRGRRRGGGRREEDEIVNLFLCHGPTKDLSYTSSEHQRGGVVLVWTVHCLRRCRWMCHCVECCLSESTSKVRSHEK